MNKTALALITAVISALTVIHAQAATYNIPKGNITDHSNPSITGSIAWYFETYGSYDTYVLTSDDYYQLSRRLVVPLQSTLTTSNNSELRANSGLDNQIMLEMFSGSTLKDLTINGNYEANLVVHARGRTNVKLLNCTIKNSKNDYPVGTRSSVKLVNLDETKNALVDSCTVLNSGYPKVNSAQLGNSWGIHATGSKNLTIQDSTIAYTLSGGIGMTSSLNATIINNSIHHIARNIEYDGGDIADGITGYSSTSIPEEHPLSWYIAFNHIYECGNHGMHVSGKDIVIEGNVTERTRFPGIAVSDWRAPHIYSSDVCIINNTCEDGYDGVEAMNVKWYYEDTIYYSGNNVVPLFKEDSPIKQDPTGPETYMYCGNEGKSVQFEQPVDLAYGANGKYNYIANFTGIITFNNSTFGDPISGVAKKGFFRKSLPSLLQNNIALDATTSASSAYSSSLVAGKASDGNSSSRWNAADRSYGDEWLELDFGEPKSYNAIYVDEFRDRIGNWRLEKSDDGTSWTTLLTGSGIELEAIVFDTQISRYLRFYIVNLKSSSSASIYEFEAYTPKLSATASASSRYSSSYTAEKANDSNSSTRWNAASGSFGDEWLAFDFGTEQSYDRVAIDEFRNRIGDWKIQKSNDGIIWKTINSGNGLTSAPIALFYPHTSRYLRLYIDNLSVSD